MVNALKYLTMLDERSFLRERDPVAFRSPPVAGAALPFVAKSIPLEIHC